MSCPNCGNQTIIILTDIQRACVNCGFTWSTK